MNKKLVALASLLLLVTVFVPGLVMGMEKQIKEKINKVEELELTPEEIKVTKKFHEEALKKLAQQHAKHGYIVQSKSENVAIKDPKVLISEKVESWVEQFKQNKVIENSCLICEKEKDTYPSIVLHNHKRKGRMGELSTPHLYHAHCLMSWYNSVNEKKKIDPFSDGNSNYAIDINCVFCKQNCQVSISELCKKYLEYWEKLSLKERFAELAIVPPNIGIKILKEVANLSVEERNQICENDASDQVIQRFICEVTKGIACSETEKKEVINAGLKILGERKPTLEFMYTACGVASEEQAITYVNQALTGPNTSLLSEQEILTNGNGDEEVEEATITERIKKHHYTCTVLLFNEACPKLPIEVQCESFEKLIKKAPNDKTKKDIINIIFPSLGAKVQLSSFDTVYEHLDVNGKVNVLVRFKDDLLKTKGTTAIMQLVRKLDGNRKLLLTYWELFPENDRLELFSTTVSQTIDNSHLKTVLIDYTAQLCQKFKESEVAPCLGKMVDFINKKSKTDVRLYQELCNALCKSTTEQGQHAAVVLFELLQKNIKSDQPDNTRIKVFKYTFSKLTKEKDKERVFTATVNNLKIDSNREKILKQLI